MDAIDAIKIDRLVTGWIVSMMFFMLTLSPLADAVQFQSGLPFILSDMLVALFAATGLAFIQWLLIKPLVHVKHWLSNTAIGAVSGAFFVGAFSIYAEASSNLAISVNLPLVYLLFVVGFTQAATLPEKFKHKWLWIVPYVLMSLSAATEGWITAFFAAALHPMFIAHFYFESERMFKKRKNSDEAGALSRLSDSVTVPAAETNQHKFQALQEQSDSK